MTDTEKKREKLRAVIADIGKAEKILDALYTDVRTTQAKLRELTAEKHALLQELLK